MRNHYLKNTALAVLMAFFMPFFNAQQINVTETAPLNLTACLDSVPFTAVITNNTAGAISNVNIMLNLFDHVNYVAGSVSGASEVSFTPANEPIFNYSGTLAVGQSITISYFVEVACDVIPVLTDGVNDAIVNTYGFTYTGGTGSQAPVAKNAYNILYTDLEVIVDWINFPPPSNFTIGERYDLFFSSNYRKIAIPNASNGATDTVVIRITPEIEIQYNGFLASNSQTPLTNVQYLPTEIIITLTGPDFVNCGAAGGDPNLFEPGETIIIFEDFTVISCSGDISDDTKYEVGVLCDAQSCYVGSGNSNESSGIYVDAGFPYIEPQIKEGSFHGEGQKGLLNFCGRDTTLTFWFINKGANDPSNTILNPGDFATDVKMHITHNMSNIAFSDFQINDVSMSALPDSVFYHANNVQTCFPATHNNTVPGYVIDLSKNIDSNLGVPDLDGDGFYDDIRDSDTVKITLKFHLTNDDPYVSCTQSVYGQIEPSVCWNNSCGTDRKEADGWYNQYAYGHLYYWHKVNQNQGDIVEPIDFVEDSTEVFRFCVGNKQQDIRIFDCPIDSFYAVVQLPPGYGLNFGVLPNFSDSALFVGDNGDSIRVSAQQIDQEIFIQGIGDASQWTGTLNWLGCYEVPILLDCDLAPGGIPGITPISWELRYVCDTCSSEQVRTCNTQNVYNHTNCASGSSCEGIVTRRPSVQRVSFGWTDHTMSQKVDENTLGINLSAVYKYDTVKAYLPGFVNSISMSQGFSTLNYNFAGSTPFFSVLGGTFKIYDSNGNFTGTTCAGINLFESTTGGVHSIRYEIPNSCLLALNVGDSIVLELDLFTQVNVADIGVDVHEIPSLRSFYSTIINDTVNQCDNWGARFYLYGTRATTEAHVAGLGCEKTKISLYTNFRSGTNGNDFPNEFRPIIRTNGPLVFTIPNGYSYEGTLGTAFYYPEGNISTPISTTSIAGLQTGNTLTFNINTLPFVDKFDIHKGAKIVEFELQPTCERSDTLASRLVYNYDNYYYTQNPAYYQNIEWWAHRQNYPLDTVNILQYNYKPNLKISVLNDVEQQGYTNEVFWDVKICNQTDNTHPQIGVANNVWFDIDNVLGNVGDITISNIVQINPFSNPITTYYNDNQSSFTEVNNIGVNQCKTYRITVNYTNCEENKVDTLRLLNGWTCDDYPNPLGAEDSVCHANEQLLFLRYKTANLQFIHTQLPSGVNSVCDTLHYEFQLTSSGSANMYDVDFWLNLPDGASASNVQYSYPNYGSWIDLDGANSNYPLYNAIGWNLTTVIPQFLANDSSFIGNRQPTQNNIWIRFDLVMDCNDFDPTKQLLINADGTTNCNDNIIQTNPYEITIEGFENLVAYELTHLDIDTLNCDESDLITFIVTNTSSEASSDQDSLRVFIPSGFTVQNVSGSYNINGNIITFYLPSISAGASSNFTFEVSSSLIVECTPISFPAEIFRTINSDCAVECPISVSWQDTINTIYCCEPCNIIATWIADTVCIGDSTCFVLLDQTTIGSDYIHSWTFGDGSSSTLAQPCHLYGEVGSYYVCHTVTQISTGCTKTYCDSVLVVEEAHGSIVFLGCNPFCEGDTVYLLVNGNYTSIEWINLTTGMSLGNMDTLIVTTSGTYTAALGNGYCIDTCLAITLTSQPLPEIEIPDKMVCDSSTLVWLDAGPGFTSYLWSTGDTTQQINVGPGTYWVEVGEQLPFGCCECKGRDTVIVSVSDLEVELRDTSICTGQSFTLTPTVTGGVPPYTYLWSTLETTPTIIVNTAGQYWVQVTDSMGCVDSDTANITLALPPNAEFTYDDTICINDTACYVALFSGIDSWTIYNSSGTVIASFGDTNEICYHYDAVGTYTVEHILTNACGSDTVRHVIVVVPPIEACIVMLGQNPFCEGDEVCLTINDPFNQVTVVDWYLDTAFVGSMDTLCVDAPGTYTAMVEDENGCTSACMCIVLTQVPRPVLNLPETVTICHNTSTTISTTSGFEQYVWMKDGVFFNYGDSVITVNQAGTYVLTVQDANGCEASDTTEVNVLPLRLNVETTSTVVCRDETFSVFTDYNANFSYSWEYQKTNDSIWLTISNSDTSYLTLLGSIMSEAVNYWFKVTVFDPISGCTSIGRVLIIHRTINCNQISIMPNPATGNATTVYYNLKDAGVQNAYLELRDMRGNSVNRIAVNPEEQRIELDIKNYASGVYQLYLFADGEFISQTRMIIAN